ncbi:uncharacterized protein LOC120298744 isoform X1 [Crotalus tigris]|uniref:uncharacterized protein LOC120298744 isoform X1 n=1 Tax=Crotalus tigris TaxID=88082 RepID=UPI00192F790F|nr:uncharacterized protein LOC120298744 isoform X1 [Crotalus tigris]
MISYKSISFILTFFNFVFLLIVVFSPCWFTHYAHVDLYYMGLWTICSEKFVCRVMKDADAYMIICRVLLMLSLVASVTSLVWMWLVKRNKLCGCPFHFPSQALTASTLSFTAGLSMLGAMLIFELRINDEELTPAPKKKWAFYLSYVILILWFFIGVYNLVCYKYSLWEGTVYSGKLSSSKMQQEEEQLQRSLEQIDQNPV